MNAPVIFPLFFICALMFVPGTARAQTIEGRVKNWASEGKGVSQAIVRAYRLDNSAKIGEAVTDFEGNYKIASLPTEVGIEIRYEKDYYIQHPVIWNTSLTTASHLTHDVELMPTKSGSRGGPSVDPNKIADYIVKHAPADDSNKAYYSSQWSDLEQFHLGEHQLNDLAMALVRRVPETRKIPGVNTSCLRWEAQQESTKDAAHR